MKQTRRNNFLSFLFPEKWIPKYSAGEKILCKTSELQRLLGVDEMTCLVLERDKQTSKHYYRVEAKGIRLLTDFKGNPVDFYIHEKNIIGNA